MLDILLKCGGIHSHEHVSLVTGGVYTYPDMYLEARHTA